MALFFNIFTPINSLLGLLMMTYIVLIRAYDLFMLSSYAHIHFLIIRFGVKALKIHMP